MGEADPWHKKEWSGGEDGEKHPVAFGPPIKEGGGFLPGAEMKHPHEPESIPLDRVRKKGKKEAAPAATHLDIQGKGVRGFDTKHTGAEREKWEEERKSRQETRCTEKDPDSGLHSRLGHCLGSSGGESTSGAHSRPADGETTPG